MAWRLPDCIAKYPNSRRCAAVCKRIRDGDIDGVQVLLLKDWRLVHARNNKGMTLLMIAAVHPDPDRAVQMIDQLVSKHIPVRCRNRRNRTALLHACFHGADRAVIEKLLEFNYNWNDVDADSQTALLLACRRADTSTATFLLDRIDIRFYAKHNHPFKVLKAAIDTGNERHALEVAQHDKIRSSIEVPECTPFKGSGALELEWTIAICTEAAVERNMLELVQVMNQSNWRKVSRAVWYMVNQLVRRGVDIKATVPPVLRAIGKLFTGGWRWSLVRDICAAHYGCGNAGSIHPLARLPQDVFHLVVAYAAPPAFEHPSGYDAGWCRCGGKALYGECYWHDSYNASRSDYYGPYNYNGGY